MANTYSTEIAAAKSGTLPQAQPDSALVSGKVRRLRASVVLAAQAIGDTITLGDLPIGANVAYIDMTSSVTLGAATIAIGVAGTAGKYRAAGVFTTVDVPTAVGPGAVAKAAAPLAAPETLIATIAAAALPAAGTLEFDIYYTTRA